MCVCYLCKLDGVRQNPTLFKSMRKNWPGIRAELAYRIMRNAPGVCPGLLQ